MSRLVKYENRIQELEARHLSATDPGLLVAVQILVEQICQEKWRPGHDRSEAQILLFRLENLLYPQG